MPIGRFGQILKLVPVLAPADITTNATKTALVDLANAHRCTFILQFGSITSSSTSASPKVTVLAATAAASTGATAIAFNYRKSSAVATDAWGTITAATAAAGVTMALTDDNMALLVDVNPVDVFNGVGTPDGRYVYVLITPEAHTTACVVGALAEIEPRYAQNSMVSAS
jgi:hypothetical protein